MTVRTASVFTCNLCFTTDTSRVDGAYEAPQEWLTVRITAMAQAGDKPDAHLCPSCKYEPVESVYDKVF